MDEMDIDKFKWFAVFFTRADDSVTIHHYIGYLIYPKKEYINHNIEEFEDDEEFELQDLVDDLEYIVVDNETALGMMDGNLDKKRSDQLRFFFLMTN